MRFFEQPILNAPYKVPSHHWELDGDGRPTDVILNRRRGAELVSAIPGAKTTTSAQEAMVFDSGLGLSTAGQEYNPTPFINELRAEIDTWRRLPNPDQWQVSPVTADAQRRPPPLHVLPYASTRARDSKAKTPASPSGSPGQIVRPVVVRPVARRKTSPVVQHPDGVPGGSGLSLHLILHPT